MYFLIEIKRAYHLSWHVKYTQERKKLIRKNHVHRVSFGTLRHNKLETRVTRRAPCI